MIGHDALVFHLRFTGILMAVLVAVNLVVPSRLRWREEMERLSLVNRQIFQVHSFFIVLMLAMFSALLLTCADALLEPTRLSRATLIGLTVFWGLRLLAQWVFYSREIWRGHRFLTMMHYLFSAVWAYVTATFAAALWSILARG